MHSLPITVARSDFGDVWVSDDTITLVFRKGVWRVDIPSADELMNDFSEVEDQKERDRLYKEASIAWISVLESEKNKLKPDIAD